MRQALAAKPGDLGSARRFGLVGAVLVAAQGIRCGGHPRQLCAGVRLRPVDACIAAIRLAQLAAMARPDRLVLLICLLGGWANASFATSLAEGNVVRVMLLFYLAPVWTMLAARIFLAEPSRHCVSAH